MSALTMRALAAHGLRPLTFDVGTFRPGSPVRDGAVDPPLDLGSVRSHQGCVGRGHHGEQRVRLSFVMEPDAPGDRLADLVDRRSAERQAGDAERPDAALQDVVVLEELRHLGTEVPGCRQAPRQLHGAVGAAQVPGQLHPGQERIAVPGEAVGDLHGTALGPERGPQHGRPGHIGAVDLVRTGGSQRPSPTPFGVEQRREHGDAVVLGHGHPIDGCPAVDERDGPTVGDDTVLADPWVLIPWRAARHALTTPRTAAGR
jgi:hypothetical protein